MSFEEQKAVIRRNRYTASAVIAAAGPALAIALRDGGASNWMAFLALSVTTLVGAGGAAVAARKTNGQISDGTFAPPPPPPPIEEQAIAAVQAVVQNAADAQAVVGRVTDGITDALGAASAAAGVAVPAAVKGAEEIVGDFLHKVTGYR